MEIHRLDDERIRICFRANPGAAEAQEWTQRIKKELTGKETVAEVDLTLLSMISSIGVSVVVGLFNCMDQQGARIQVLVPNEQMLHVFELFRLDRVFSVKLQEPTPS